MKKKLLFVIFAFIFILAGFNNQSFAANDCSLTVICQYDGVAISDVKVNIYRIADSAFSDEVVLLKDFEDLNNEMDFSSTKTVDASALTLYSFCVANNIAPIASTTADALGNAIFNNIEDGYYLVTIDKLTKDDYEYHFAPFIVSLPDMQRDNHNVEAYPKASRNKAEEYFDLSVVIIWYDEGFEENRPESVIVDIYSDGVLFTKVELSEANNWQCELTNIEADHEWVVVEHNSNKRYLVNIEKPLKNKFVIEYKIKDEKLIEKPEDILPQTGIDRCMDSVLVALGLIFVAIVFILKIIKEQED